MSTQTKPSIVFVHGIWADGSCFSKVIPTLQAEGYEVMASQHRLDTLEGDVATVTRTLGMLPKGVETFAGDLSEQEQKVVWATHVAPAADLFNQKVAGTAWRSKPSWYIVAKNDRTVQPELQRFVAKRMGATIHDVESSHVPMLSNPGIVIDVIRTAANAVGRR